MQMLSDMFNTGAAARRAQKFPWAASVWINLLSVLLRVCTQIND